MHSAPPLLNPEPRRGPASVVSRVDSCSRSGLRANHEPLCGHVGGKRRPQAPRARGAWGGRPLRSARVPLPAQRRRSARRAHLAPVWIAQRTGKTSRVTTRLLASYPTQTLAVKSATDPAYFAACSGSVPASRPRAIAGSSQPFAAWRRRDPHNCHHVRHMSSRPVGRGLTPSRLSGEMYTHTKIYLKLSLRAPLFLILLLNREKREAGSEILSRPVGRGLTPSRYLPVRYM